MLLIPTIESQVNKLSELAQTFITRKLISKWNQKLRWERQEWLEFRQSWTSTDVLQFAASTPVLTTVAHIYVVVTEFTIVRFYAVYQLVHTTNAALSVYVIDVYAGIVFTLDLSGLYANQDIKSIKKIKERMKPIKNQIISIKLPPLLCKRKIRLKLILEGLH